MWNKKKSVGASLVNDKNRQQRKKNKWKKVGNVGFKKKENLNAHERQDKINEKIKCTYREKTIEKEREGDIQVRVSNGPNGQSPIYWCERNGEVNFNEKARRIE